MYVLFLKIRVEFSTLSLLSEGKGAAGSFLSNCWALSPTLRFEFLEGVVNWSRKASEMGTRIKGIYKGFKHTLSKIFVVKEREMEIGYPTDVKHLAHIGWDGPSGNAPTWMSEFRTVPDFTATSIGNSGSALSPWSSVDFGEIMRKQSEADMFKDLSTTELPSVKGQQKRKKSKSTSSPSYSNSPLSSRVSKTKAK